MDIFIQKDDFGLAYQQKRQKYLESGRTKGKSAQSGQASAVCD